MAKRGSFLGWMLCGGIVAGLTALTLLAPSPRAPAPASIGGAFRLVDTDGRIVTDRSFASQYKLIYFGYTSCAEICPTTLAHVAAALSDLGPISTRIQALFITLDPRRDTPTVLRRYTAAITPRLVGLTGSPEELRQVSRSFHVWSADGQAGQIDHSAVLYLLAPDGRFVAPLRSDLDSHDMALRLQALVDGGLVSRS